MGTEWDPRYSKTLFLSVLANWQDIGAIICIAYFITAAVFIYF